MFERSFPMIESFSFDGIMTNGFWPLSNGGKISFNKINYPGDLIPCQNPSCREGGFTLFDAVNEMVRQKNQASKFDKKCKGNEAGDRKKSGGRSCAYMVTGHITITFKPE
jgi:hypothetical protein